MKKDLFVFCGQSNMMGAASISPSYPLDIKDSYEYRHKNAHLGRGDGEFVPVSHDVGEFLYRDIAKAYPENSDMSELADYANNTYFAPSLSCAAYGKQECFWIFSEKTRLIGSSVVPYFCEQYEKAGGSSLVTHIAKGSINISYYFDENMAASYNRQISEHNKSHATDYRPMTLTPLGVGAARVFAEKTSAFFAESERKFTDIGKKVFVWLQGESDSFDSLFEHRLKLDILHCKLKAFGFDAFFCIRVGYWGYPNIINVINAQESLCEENADCYMVSRAVSYMPDILRKPPEGWFLKAPDERYHFCRDSYYGYQNSHINEKGFMLVGAEAAKNAYRILRENKAPIHDEEILNLNYKEIKE